MKLDLSQIPEDTLRAVRMLAVQQGVFLIRNKDYVEYILDDEDALELVLPYLPESPI